MNHYTYIEKYGDKIYHRYWDGSRRRQEVTSEFPIELFVQSDNSDSRGLQGEHLGRIEFSDVRSASEFQKDHSDSSSIHGQTNLLSQFLTHRYPGDIEFDIGNFVIVAIDIETKSDSGFPYPDTANQEITAITCKTLHTGHYVTWGCKPFEDDSDNEYHLCTNESDLLIQFVGWWSRVKPDIVCGWNCVPLNQSLWTKSKIVRMSDSRYKTELYNSYIHHVFPQSKKIPYTITLDNKWEVRGSSDHVFPVYYLPKDSYIDPENISCLIEDDASIKKIQSLIEDNSVYVRQDLRKNDSNDLTYRTLISDNLDLLISKGFDMIIRDSEIVKKMTAKTGVACWNRNKREDWSISRITECLSRKEVCRFIDRSQRVIVYTDMIGKSTIEIDLDTPISQDDLWLAGIWYTDGTNSYKTEVSICNTDSMIVEKSIEIFNEYRRVPIMELKPSKRDANCYYVTCGLSSLWFIKMFIYESIKPCSKKRIDIELLSQLSRRQFLSFFGGCVDGDGSVHDRGYVTLCNYNDDIRNFAELLHWNGIFCTIQSGANTLSCHMNLDFESYLVHSKKRMRLTEGYTGDRLQKTKSNNIRNLIYDDYALVKIKSICSEDSEVDMIDISTDTHYFVTSGVKTHNCVGFDIPYIVNRITRVVGSDFAERLSPFCKDAKKIFSEYKIQGDQTSYRILGVNILDYMELYKKYSNDRLESYSLNYVSYHELGEKKLDYSDAGSLTNLYEQDYSKFILYNQRDVHLIELLDEKLNFIFLALTMMFMGKVRCQDIFSQVRFWDNMVYLELLKGGIQQPPMKHFKADGIAGAFVKDPAPGMYHWVASLDLTSLYPMITVQCNASPETLVRSSDRSNDQTLLLSLLNRTYDTEYLKENDWSMMANGAAYTRTKRGILPKLINKMFADRKRFKGEMLAVKKEIEEINLKIQNYK